jgi:tRNA1Val (adenine37-N6)-methyltransferase
MIQGLLMKLTEPHKIGTKKGEEMASIPAPDETLDRILDGTLQILQKKRGYRFSIDAIILSRFIRIRKTEKAIDLGTGCGILPILLSQTTPVHSLVGVEIQKALAELAQRNVQLNHLDHRITILHQDYTTLKQTLSPGSFDVVYSNPPYRKALTGRVNPATEKAIARHEIKGTIGNLIEMASYLLPTRGRCYLIYAASRAIDLLVSLRLHRLEPKRIRLIHPKSGEEAKFILVESAKGGGKELKVEAPLFLEEPFDPSPGTRDFL